MGLLAENKSRKKISTDPNNTKWTRDETTFGQKILRSQGWQPGQYLGAKDAPHSELHTAANASYIRVSLKDDMKGLGFNKAKEDEVTGLDVFSDLLSRLNGKSTEAVESDRQVRLAFKTHAYVERRWGPMRFIKGGLLVGEDMKEEQTEDDTNDSDAEAKKSKKGKKRKASAVEDDNETKSSTSEEKTKKRRKEERNGLKDSAGSSSSEEATHKDKKKEKKRSKKDETLVETAITEADETISDAGDDDVKESKKERKERKRKEKEEKKDRKEKKRRNREAAESGFSEPATDIEQASLVSSAAGTGQSTPTGTGTGTSTPRGNRNFVRARFIAQKKQAVLDAASLNQIFMLKT